MSNKKQKGFTLMEMLIVVAIIAVLIAMAIVFFNTALEKTREATDIANIRSAYATVSVEALTSSNDDIVETVQLVQKKDGWQSDSLEETLNTLGDVSGDPSEGGSCDVSWQNDTFKVLFTFNGIRINFPDDDEGFARAYAKLIEKYFKEGVMNNRVAEGKAVSYNGHKLIDISNNNGNWQPYISAQMHKDGYPKELLDLFDNKKVTAIAYYEYNESDKSFTLVAYKYQFGTRPEPTMCYLKDAKGNKIISDSFPPNKYGDIDIKNIIADYYWD